MNDIIKIKNLKAYICFVLLLNEAASSEALLSAALAEFSNTQTNIEQKIFNFFLFNLAFLSLLGYVSLTKDTTAKRHLVWLFGSLSLSISFLGLKINKDFHYLISL